MGYEPGTRKGFQHDFCKEAPGLFKDSYEKIGKDKLGEGSYGSVFLAQPKGSDKRYAIKEIKTKKNNTAKIPDETAKLLREVAIQKVLDHPNIVKIYEYFGLREASSSSEEIVHFVMEFCDGGELFDRIIDAAETNQQGMAFGERDAAGYMKQIIGAIGYVHSKSIAHRDIKPENFLMENKAKEAQIKVIDFGLGKIFKPGENMKTKAGTPFYVAPEVLKGSYDERCDVWSCGVICYILLSGVPPFYGDSDPEILSAVKACKYDYPSPEWDGISSDAKHLIDGMLTDIKKESKKERGTFGKSQHHPKSDDLALHPWLNDESEKKDTTLPTDLFKNLKKFTEKTGIQKLAASIMAKQLSDGEIAELKKTFQDLDKNNDGTLTKEELVNGFKKSSLPFDETVLDRIDTDGSGQIDYTEFVAAAAAFVSRNFRDVSITATFRFLDLDGDGYITKSELEKHMKENPDELVEMISKHDSDGDGRISFEEFKVMMTAEAAAR